MIKKKFIITQSEGKNFSSESGDNNKIHIDHNYAYNSIFGKKYVVDSGDSNNLKVGQIIDSRKLREENSRLKREDLRLVDSRDAIPAISKPVLQGITRASLQTNSWISAASFNKLPKC